MLEFDEATHRYFFDGTRVPNVTSILELFSDWSKVPADVLEKARLEGKAIHSMVELHAKNDLEAVPKWMAGHLVAWEKFVASTGFEVILSERRVYHPRYKYAGTLDLFGHVRGGKFALIDIKRSFNNVPVIGLQTAAYLDCLVEEPPVFDAKAIRGASRMALVLRADGSFRTEHLTDDNDFNTFVGLLVVHK